MCKLFETIAKQDFKKLIIFSVSSKHFIKELAQGKLSNHVQAKQILNH